jgi:uncharacterized protein (DUF1501 family)
MNFTRRNFLRGVSGAAGLLAASAGLDRFSLLESAALAAPLDYTGYRALVGVFLLGGNDANNMIIPYPDAAYAKYAAHRTPDDIGIAKAELTNTVLNPTGLPPSTYALHPKMPKLTALFNTDKKLACVFNVGTLVKPTSLAQYKAGSVPLPENLFSHSDQQDAWATAIVDPTVAAGAGLNVRSGWGGRAADRLTARNAGALLPTFPIVTSYGGRPVFGVGGTQQPLTVSSTGALALSGTGSAAIDKIRQTALDEMKLVTSGVAPQDAFTTGFALALDNAATRAAALKANTLPASVSAFFAEPTAATAGNNTPVPISSTTLGQQLLGILKDIFSDAIATATGLNLKRQIFSAGLGGFDTHSGELFQHNALYGQIDDAFDAFYRALAELNGLIAGNQIAGLTQPVQVTLFTMSDFGRTFQPNSTGGSDHGWGSHHLVLGDQVVGGACYGNFPDLTLLSDSAGALSDVGEGRWLPTTSADQYGNTLAYWLGITTVAARNAVFPRIANFGTKTLAFMG